MRKSRAFIPPGFGGPFEPGDRFIQPVQFDKIGPDVVIRIPEVRVRPDGPMTFFNGFVQLAHEAVGPPEEGIGFGRREGVDGVPVEFDGVIQLAVHLTFVGLLE